MRSAPTLLVVALVAVAAVVAAPVAALGASTGSATAPATGPSSADVATDLTADRSVATAADNHSNDSNLSAGQQLSAVVGVGQAEVEGEVEERSFALQLGNASNDSERAQVVGENARTLRQELSDVRERIDELRQAREDGNISEAEYRARVAPLAARAQGLERQVNATSNASEGIPADVLEANGVNTSALQELKNNAANLSGGEVSEIARSIGGPNTGSPVRSGPPEEVPGGGNETPGGERGGDAGNETAGGDRGGDAGNETGAGAGDDTGADAGADDGDVEPTVENATDRVETARERVAAAEENVTGDAGADALDDATTALENAETALENARDATGEARTDYAQAALDEAATAIESAEAAIDRSNDTDGSDSGAGGGSGGAP